MKHLSFQSLLKTYLKLSKAGITFFALLSAGAGYLLAYHTRDTPYLDHVFSPFGWLMGGLYLVVSGSFILNQAYEWRLDSLMKRTQNRPVPAGKLTAVQALTLGFFLIILGLFILLALKPVTAGWALLAVLLYNVFYTMRWKKRWAFSAVPGALPGALPVLIGWSVPAETFWSVESLYLFFILFLWQLPHFWSLALHYKEDYKLAGVPVLPLQVGQNKTLKFMGFYLVAYIGLALLGPLLFIPLVYAKSQGTLEMTNTADLFRVIVPVVYLVLLLFSCLKVFWEFIKFSKTLNWKPFFICLNLSVLVFLYAPVLQVWCYSFIM